MVSELPLACVALIGHRSADGARALHSALRRALEEHHSDALFTNLPVEFDALASDPLRSTKRQFAFVLCADTSPALLARRFDAAVLVLSALRSVSERTRALVHELSAHAHPCPIAVCVTDCLAIGAEPDLVEIEARELLTEFALDGDGVEVFRTRAEEHTLEVDDGVRAAIEWLDANATVCQHASELPLIARVENIGANGWCVLRRSQGVLVKETKLLAIQGAATISVTVAEGFHRNPTRDPFGLSALQVRWDPSVLPSPRDLVVSEAAVVERASFSAALFGAERLIDGWLAERFTLRWGSGTVPAVIEVERTMGAGLAVARVVPSFSIPVVPRVGFDVMNGDELVFSAVVCDGR